MCGVCTCKSIGDGMVFNDEKFENHQEGVGRQEVGSYIIITALMSSPTHIPSRLTGWSRSPRDDDIHGPVSGFTARGDVREFETEWVRRLKEAGIPEPELSVRFIVEHVWSMTAGDNAAVS